MIYIYNETISSHIYNNINIVTNGNYSLRILNQKCMEIRQNIDLYQYPAASLFQCIFTF